MKRTHFALAALSLAIAVGMPASAAKTVITYATWWGGDLAEVEKLAIRTFQERYPDIEVKMTTSDFSSFHDKLLTATIGGSAPDVYKADIYYMRDYIDAGIALPIDAYVKRDKMNFDSWYKFTLEPVTDPFSGRLMGFPSNWGGLVLYANNAIFERSAVPLPTDGWTWDKFIADMSKIKRDVNGDGKIDQWGFAPGMWCWWAWAYTNGASLFSKNERKFNINTPEVNESLKWLADLRFASMVSPGLKDGYGDWLTGKSGLLTDWSHVLPRVKVKFDMTMLELPYNKSRAYTIKGDCMAIHAASKKKEAAWKFMQWYVGESYQTAVMKSTGLAPLQRRVAETEWVKWRRDAKYDINMKAALPTQAGRVVRLLEAGTPTWRKMEQVWGPELDRIITGARSAKDITLRLEKPLQSILDQYWTRMDKRRKK